MDNTEPMAQWFVYAHLPEELANISSQFSELASWITDNLPRNPERTVALRKLLEARGMSVWAWARGPLTSVQSGPGLCCESTSLQIEEN